MELIEKVAKMRIAQREYFRTRSRDALVEAREWERKVDAAIAEYEKPNLFNSVQ